MKVALHHEGRELPCRLPYAGADHVYVFDENDVDNVVCPACDLPLGVRSPDHEVVEDRMVRGRAFCVVCGFRVGELVVTLDTIFGATEDARVTSGSLGRVY